jgi:hypothetical protein
MLGDRWIEWDSVVRTHVFSLTKGNLFLFRAASSSSIQERDWKLKNEEPFLSQGAH